MRNFIKTPEVPECLSHQMTLRTGKYDCGNVAELLSKDFKNKCYICEDNNVTNMNIEHFVPKSLGRDHKFNWDNLFFACRHCNGIKSDDFNTTSNNQILNCLVGSANVLGGINYKIEDKFNKVLSFEALNKDKNTLNTVELLDLTHNTVSTEQRKVQAQNVRKRIIKEINRFERIFEGSIGLPEDEETVEEMQNCMKKGKAFSAFKIWHFISIYGKENLPKFIGQEEFNKYFA